MTDQAYPDALPAQYRMHWYTIERVLGQGGFGITYLARDTNLAQLVALKEYLPVEVATRRHDSTVQSRSDGQRERYRWGLERFIQEARTLARFDHPNIVRVHSVFEFNGTAYMVMRFEEGENLGALLNRRGILPEHDLLRVLLPVLDGLELVHNAGFIHRDIKPDNIHIRADGTPVLLDFGSARHALGKAHTLTILVAPGYAPFEQYYASSENQGPWSDIYSLGATCYRAIAGTPPLDAISRSKGILGSTREVLVPARTLGSGRYSGQLLAAVDHALEFAEKDRPQTISEWRRELAGEIRAPSMAPTAPERPAAGTPTSPGPRPAPSGAGTAVAREAGAPERRPAPAVSAVTRRAGWSRARTPIAWVLAGAGAGAIAIAIFLGIDTPLRDAEQRLAESKQQLEEERKRLQEERKRDEARRRQEEEARLAEQRKRGEAKRRQEEEARLAEQQKREEAKRQQEEEARLAEQRKREEAKRRQEEEARLAEQRRREEAKRRQEEEARLAEQRRRDEERRRLEEQQRKAALAARASKPTGATDAAATRPPPAVLPFEPQPAESPPVVAAVKPPGLPRVSPQVEQLARGEGALTRGDYTAALEILRPLAAGGNTTAQVRLGDMYANGQGVHQNYNQAYIWYSLAVRGGNAAAMSAKAKMAARLQPAEIKQADRVVESMQVR